jgi:hypothetical protein
MHARKPLMPVSQVAYLHRDKRAMRYDASPIPLTTAMRMLALGDRALSARSR